jgi:hypothetical protein
MPKSSDATSAKVKKTAGRKNALGKNEEKSDELASKEPAKAAKKETKRKSKVATVISPEERHHLISVAAYFIAERRTYPYSLPHDDWLQAEREIDAMIAAGKFDV